ncbi:MAG: type II toxin-antitoxin system HicB family antitoxin [Patescibacteria group bacterium]|nr:type II toxin-antitoxin system HicB family antitoxin [Patescibacteria group bacterium]
MSKQYEYKIEYEFDTETKLIIATIPELNHTSSFGKTFAEAEANVKEAVLCYLEAIIKEHKTIPEPVFHTEGTYLKLFAPQGI